MSFSADIAVCNPSEFERHDYVEVDLERLGVSDTIPDEALWLYRVRDGRKGEEVSFQIDYPFGRAVTPPLRPVRGRRVMTFKSEGTPPGVDDYSRPSATFRLESGAPRSAAQPHPLLWVEHYSAPAVHSRVWSPGARVTGVKLGNGGPEGTGLEVYFSLVAKPQPESPINYAGAATSVLHYRACRGRPDCRDLLSPLFTPCADLAPNKELARWGQLQRLDFYPPPWQPQWYHSEHLLEPAQDGSPREYMLVWSQVGPCRATVTFASTPITLRFATTPSVGHPDLVLTCRLYRIISLHPGGEYYTEQLAVRPDEHPGVSLAFRAHFQSYVDVGALRPRVARQESVPDYFAVWWKWMRPHPMNLGYGFASDSHVRDFSASGSDVRWRLQLGHEPRCVHCFLYEPHQNFGLYHTVGHDAWYLRVFKPLEMIPFTRYLRR